MPECHTCPHNKTQSEQCLKCEGASNSPKNHGRSHVSYEFLNDTDAAEIIPMTPHEESKLSGFMRLWLTLDSQMRDIIADMLADTSQTQSSIATKHNISLTLMHWRLTQLAEKYPVLQVVLKLKMKSLRISPDNTKETSDI